jgi:hypothetical protein
MGLHWFARLYARGEMKSEKMIGVRMPFASKQFNSEERRRSPRDAWQNSSAADSAEVDFAEKDP